MRAVYRMLLIFIALFTISFIVMSAIKIEESSPIGRALINAWLSGRGYHDHAGYVDINSTQMALLQAVMLATFLFVVAGTVMRMEWRVGLAVMGLLVATFFVTPPQILIKEAIEWNLILFLIGSMIFAGILRELGVFRLLAANIVRVSRGNSIFMLLLLVLLSFTTAAILDEVTSIVYITLLVFELASILGVDVMRLLIIAVLATNTGSLALPIGNPIGIYLFFVTKMPFSTYVSYALPLALMELVVLFLVLLIVERKFIAEMDMAVKSKASELKSFVERYYRSLDKRSFKNVRFGLALLIAFIAMISLNEPISHLMESMFHAPVDSHSLIAFIPYIFVILGISVIPMEDIPKHIEKSVEWPAIMFFIGLFILGYSLLYCGAMVKIAYVFSHFAWLILPIMLISSTYLSAVLDNLSVIVAFTPMAILMYTTGLSTEIIYFALLAGGVLGGNYTPIGSTANIVAVSIAERRGVYVSWRSWLKISSITTTVQVLSALAWIQMYQVLHA